MDKDEVLVWLERRGTRRIIGVRARPRVACASVQQIWLREAARSRFDDPAGFMAALEVGLECGRHGSSNELAQMTAMVEDIDRLALLS